MYRLGQGTARKELDTKTVRVGVWFLSQLWVQSVVAVCVRSKQHASQVEVTCIPAASGPRGVFPLTNLSAALH
ncbi:hypothetical protein BC826DRAFT_1028964 [Russula brevipes]|nr:hypothetical protein BC826DRAFT_1028964 [Russula brevipes]